MSKKNVNSNVKTMEQRREELMKKIICDRCGFKNYDDIPETMKTCCLEDAIEKEEEIIKKESVDYNEPVNAMATLRDIAKETTYKNLNDLNDKIIKAFSPIVEYTFRRDMADMIGADEYYNIDATMLAEVDAMSYLWRIPENIASVIDIAMNSMEAARTSYLIDIAESVMIKNLIDDNNELCRIYGEDCMDEFMKDAANRFAVYNYYSISFDDLPELSEFARDWRMSERLTKKINAECN